jgi:predicted DCC family thiol-disulfide oxidoreductase YuxK
MQAYSHRNDPAVPAFDDTGPRTVMDAHCALCARGARWIARRDKRREFRIVPLQSDLGRALMTHYGMDPDDPTSWLYLEDGIPHTSLHAFTRVARRIGGIWHIVRLLNLLPRAAQDPLYRTVARNRIRLFGTADLCNMPDPDVQDRLLQ